MPIPESQLLTWTGQGSVTNSANTHSVLRNALAAHNWSSYIEYADYLQGSYANTTNIRGDSDVDIVVECTSIFYNNLTESEKQSLGFTPGIHSLDDFRNEVIQALVSYYGSAYVDTSGGNSIKVLPSSTSNRLYADVVVCASYRRYDSLKLVAEGITFWNQKNYNQIINYPKIHKNNGVTKNSNTNGNYKPVVRMFKNARRYMINGNEELKKKFPSYFVECLLYNVPNHCFLPATYQSKFLEVLVYLLEIIDTEEADKFTTQSGLHWLFGNSSVQWSKDNAKDFLTRLSKLWQNF